MQMKPVQGQASLACRQAKRVRACAHPELGSVGLVEDRAVFGAPASLLSGLLAAGRLQGTALSQSGLVRILAAAASAPQGQAVFEAKPSPSLVRYALPNPSFHPTFNSRLRRLLPAGELKR